MAKFTKKITNLINQQVPEFVLSDHPKFLEFCKIILQIYGIGRDYSGKYRVDWWYSIRVQ